MTYNDYLSHLNKSEGGKVAIYSEKISEDPERLCLHYHDVSWSSHIYDDKWRDLKKELQKNKEMIQEVSLDLFYLHEADETIYFNSDAEDGNIGSWDEEE